MRQTKSGSTHFARACAVEMHVDISRGFDARICKKNAGAQDRDTQIVQTGALKIHMDTSPGPRPSKTRAADCVRARAIEMHMDIAQEQFHARI